MIHITRDISISDDEIRVDFVRASGPGGQNVNKVSTAAQLRFDVLNCPSLPEDVKQRLVALAGRRVSTAGVLVIHCDRRRTQERNRRDAVSRFVELVRQAAVRPKVRRKTKPTIASRRRRLETKRRRGETKRLRRDVSGGDQ